MTYSRTVLENSYKYYKQYISTLVLASTPRKCSFIQMIFLFYVIFRKGNTRIFTELKSEMLFILLVYYPYYIEKSPSSIRL